MYSKGLESRVGDMAWSTFDVATSDGSVIDRWEHTGGHMQASRLQLDRWRTKLLVPIQPARLVIFVWCETDFTIEATSLSNQWQNTVFEPQSVQVYTNINTLTLVDFLPIEPDERFWHFRVMVYQGPGTYLDVRDNLSTAKVLALRN